MKILVNPVECKLSSYSKRISGLQLWSLMLEEATCADIAGFCIQRCSVCFAVWNTSLNKTECVDNLYMFLACDES